MSGSWRAARAGSWGGEESDGAGGWGVSRELECARRELRVGGLGSRAAGWG